MKILKIIYYIATCVIILITGAMILLSIAYGDYDIISVGFFILAYLCVWVYGCLEEWYEARVEKLLKGKEDGQS